MRKFSDQLKGLNLCAEMKVLQVFVVSGQGRVIAQTRGVLQYCPCLRRQGSRSPGSCWPGGCWHRRDGPQNGRRTEEICALRLVRSHLHHSVGEEEVINLGRFPAIRYSYPLGAGPFLLI